jgi:drug/metabolite transporter (DMT)-like permease
MSATAIILTLIIGLIGTAGHLFLIKALTLGEASLVAPFGYTSLIFATMWGVILFNNYPDFWTISGAIVIVGAGVYVWARERAAKPIQI